MSKPFGEELLFQRAEAGTLTPDEQRKLAKRGRERLSKIAGWCEQNVALRAENKILMEAIRRIAEQDATLSVVGGNVIVQMDATLTDAEREALRKVLRLLREGFFRDSSIELVQAASVIDGLLDRQG